MKKLFLLCLTMLSLSAMYAQECMPQQNLPDTLIGVVPLPYSDTLNPTGGITDTACINEPFNFVFTVVVPGTFDSPFGPVPINRIDMATQGAIKNLPAGITYACNPPNCSFPKDTVGCIVLYGTPTGSPGVSNLEIDFVIRSLIDFPLTFPNATLYPGNYFLHVKPQGQCAPSSVRTPGLSGVEEVAVRPNPFSSYAQLLVNSKISGNFDLIVSDALGRQLRRERVHLLEGDNTLDFDGSALPSGMYIYTLSNGTGAISGRMIIQK